MKKFVSMLAVLFVGFLFACASTPTEDPKPAPEAETAAAEATEATADEATATDETPSEAPAAEEEAPVSGSGTEGE